MGTSTDAILFYGYVWEDETSRPWTIGKEYDEDSDESQDEEDDSWEERYANAMGLKRPEAKFPDGVYNVKTGQYDHPTEDQPLLDEYSAYWKAKYELAAASPVMVDTHCSCECPMPLVAIRESYTCSSRGDATEITSLKKKPEWNKQLKTFCKVMGIDVKGKKPGWFLVSNWC